MIKTKNVVVLCIAITFTRIVLGQVASLCRPNERFLSCGGCQKTCLNPTPACAAVCREGCYCPEELVRNSTGHCIPLSECPSSQITYQDETSESRPKDHQCPENEEYRFCEPCNKTCDNPNPICPAQCGRGCFCKDDLVRDTNGKCVKLELCGISEVSNYISKYEDSRNLTMCGPNKEFKQCESCERSCSNTNPICPAQCSTGCFCKEGFYKASNGECVTLDNCRNEQLIRKVALMSPSGAYELTVEDCSPEEEYLSCGWCEPTCSDPRPLCPVGVCTRGCLCRPPLLRHYSGLCVEPKNCLPQKCPNSNEEYVCRYGCDAWCDRRGCASRPRGCSLGCHCKLGMLRDPNTGLCVTPDQCSKHYTYLL